MKKKLVISILSAVFFMQTFSAGYALSHAEAKSIKQQVKADKKAAKKAEKAAKKAAKKSKNDENASDAAYQAGIYTGKIIQVEDCIKLALENHPAIQAAMADTDIYKSRIAQAWSAFFPVLSAGISYSRNDMQTVNVAAPVQRYDMYYVPSLSANMLVFDFGKTKAAADIAKRGYEAAEYNLENNINTVIFNVKQSYYNLLFALQQVKVYEDAVKDYQIHLEQAKAYYDIGKKPKIDVLTAEYNLGNANLNLIHARNTLKIAYVSLSNAMGLPELEDYDVIDNLKEKNYDITAEKAVNTAYETSPELLAAKKRSDASALLIRASKRAFLPDITAFASYTKGGRSINTDDGYQFGARLGYSDVNLLLLKKQMDEAKAQYKKDYADYRHVKQNIYYEVKQAYLNLITARQSIDVSRLSMNQAQEQYDSASGRYKAGLGDAVALKDSETTFRNAQLDYYNTLLNYHTSAANLERLMGAPLEIQQTETL